MHVLHLSESHTFSSFFLFKVISSLATYLIWLSEMFLTAGRNVRYTCITVILRRAEYGSVPEITEIV